MMENWTNGELVATSHRVRRVSEERYSFPLFFACDYGTVVEPLPAFVGPDRPPRYPPLVAGEHLWAQTIQSFSYLKQRLARGEVTLPARARPLGSFGQQAAAADEPGRSWSTPSASPAPGPACPTGRWAASGAGRSPTSPGRRTRPRRWCWLQSRGLTARSARLQHPADLRQRDRAGARASCGGPSRAGWDGARDGVLERLDQLPAAQPLARAGPVDPRGRLPDRVRAQRGLCRGLAGAAGEPRVLVGLRLEQERVRPTGEVRHRGGGLLVAGGHAMLVRGRPEPPDVRAGARLPDVLDYRGFDRPLLSSLFSCEVSHALRYGPPGERLPPSSCRRIPEGGQTAGAGRLRTGRRPVRSSSGWRRTAARPSSAPSRSTRWNGYRPSHGHRTPTRRRAWFERSVAS